MISLLHFSSKTKKPNHNCLSIIFNTREPTSQSHKQISVWHDYLCYAEIKYSDFLTSLVTGNIHSATFKEKSTVQANNKYEEKMALGN